MSIRRYSKKGLEKRKKERKELPEFYRKHINKIKTEKIQCEECGGRLRGHASEVAHILPKSYYKSVATKDSNILYLCGMFSDNRCHSKFDELPMKEVWKMKVFEKAKERFNMLKESAEEKLTYKTIDRYRG